MALSIYVLSLRQTFEKLLTGVKVWCKAQKIDVGCKLVNEIDPGSQVLVNSIKNNFCVSAMIVVLDEDLFLDFFLV